MSNTPRTDVVVNKSAEEDDGKYLAEDLLFHSRELERENAKLRENKERLDWLLENAIIQYYQTIHPDDLCRITSKDDVDNAMKGTI